MTATLTEASLGWNPCRKESEVWYLHHQIPITYLVSFGEQSLDIFPTMSTHEEREVITSTYVVWGQPSYAPQPSSLLLLWEKDNSQQDPAVMVFSKEAKLIWWKYCQLCLKVDLVQHPLQTLPCLWICLYSLVYMLSIVFKNTLPTNSAGCPKFLICNCTNLGMNIPESCLTALQSNR